MHLQCHFGIDTLSWARHGARVTGLDFSAPAIEAARALALDIGVDADFVCADVYDAVEVLDRRRFDVVYVNLGAINWLPDIRRWAGIVEALLEPGGVLFMKEVHPFSWIFSDDDLTVDGDYFAHRNDYDEPGTYTDPEAPTVHNRTEEWQHPLSEVVNAVIGAGLVLESLEEYDHQVYQQWPFMEQRRRDLSDAEGNTAAAAHVFTSCPQARPASRPPARQIDSLETRDEGAVLISGVFGSGEHGGRRSPTCCEQRCVPYALMDRYRASLVSAARRAPPPATQGR